MFFVFNTIPLASIPETTNLLFEPLLSSTVTPVNKAFVISSIEVFVANTILSKALIPEKLGPFLSNLKFSVHLVVLSPYVFVTVAHNFDESDSKFILITFEVVSIVGVQVASVVKQYLILSEVLVPLIVISKFFLAHPFSLTFALFVNVNSGIGFATVNLTSVIDTLPASSVKVKIAVLSPGSEVFNFVDSPSFLITSPDITNVGLLKLSFIPDAI